MLLLLLPLLLPTVLWGLVKGGTRRQPFSSSPELGAEAGAGASRLTASASCWRPGSPRSSTGAARRAPRPSRPSGTRCAGPARPDSSRPKRQRWLRGCSPTAASLCWAQGARAGRSASASRLAIPGCPRDIWSGPVAGAARQQLRSSEQLTRDSSVPCQPASDAEQSDLRLATRHRAATMHARIPAPPRSPTYKLLTPSAAPRPRLQLGMRFVLLAEPP